MSEISLELEFNTHDGITVGTITHTQMLDGTNVASFGAQALAYVEEHPNPKLIINFENINYMSSAGLTELLRINEALKPDGEPVHLWGLNNDIYNVFRITNLDKMFTIHNDDTIDSACSSFKETVQPGSGI
ncbi:MAG: STAS domain-containing protein [Candidatus Hydrogenedentota bacterium]